MRKYGLRLSDRALAACRQKRRKHCRTQSPGVTGSVAPLSMRQSRRLQTLGYRCIRLTDCLSCEAREAGRFLAARRADARVTV